MKKLSHFMVDFETTGLDPQFSGVIEIGAVEFKMSVEWHEHKGCLWWQIDPIINNTFSNPIQLLPTRSWDPKTFMWWSSNDEMIAHREYCEREGEDPRTVFYRFINWVKSTAVGMPIFWAKPSFFDYGFLDSHCKELRIHNTFYYRNIRDVATFCYTVNPEFDLKNVTSENPHQALDDCFHQINLMKKAAGNGEVE